MNQPNKKLLESIQQSSIYKIIIVGDAEVGKSSILTTFVSDVFRENQTTPTLGVDIQFKDSILNGRKVQLQLWDTAGTDRYKAITRAYYKGADAVLLVYDVTQYNSFDGAINYWFKEMTSHLPDRTLKILVANKIDKQMRVVQRYQGQQFAQQNNLIFFETSASDSHSINEIFNTIVEKIISQGQISELGGSSRIRRSQPQEKNCFRRILEKFGL